MNNAIREEEYFHQFYLKLSERATNPEVKQTLKTLSDQEAAHKQRLESINLAEDEDKYDTSKLDEEMAEKDAKQIPLEDFEDVKSMLIFAIKQESIAKATYTKLAQSTQEPEYKETFLKLADEEGKHQLLLTGKLALLEQEGETAW